MKIGKIDIQAVANVRPVQNILADIKKIDEQIAALQTKREQTVTEFKTVTNTLNEYAKQLA